MNLVNIFLAVSTADFENMAYGDKMMLGLTITGIGILMVFVILALIILSIDLMNVILDKVVPNIKLPKSKKNKAKEVEDKIVAEPITNTTEYVEVDDKKIVACISAAVMQMLEEENDGRKPNISFRISSIKKVK